jgi:hypothetical protein
VPAATPELSPLSAPARNPYLESAPDPSIARDTPLAVRQNAYRGYDFLRPVWLSPELGSVGWAGIRLLSGLYPIRYFR